MNYYGNRNRLAQMMIEKSKNDQALSQLDKNAWYMLRDIQELNDLSMKFLRLNDDQETTEFIDKCYEKSDWFFTQLFHSMMLSMLRWFMTTTSINGLLQRGSMFVFSVQQFRMLIDYDSVYGGSKLRNLLDLGAGDGCVTSKMAPFFENVYATEMSYTMQWRLQQKGFKVVDVENWDKIDESSLQYIKEDDSENRSKFLRYDAIACLNLLDRCDTPISFLKKMKNSLVPNGLLIVAIVLPFKSFVEYNKDNRPQEDLFDLKKARAMLATNSTSHREPEIINQDGTCEKDSCDDKTKMNKLNYQIDYLVREIFEPIGFDLVKFTKLPYLCEGNLAQSYYYMFDYVFILRSTN